MPQLTPTTFMAQTDRSVVCLTVLDLEDYAAVFPLLPADACPLHTYPDIDLAVLAVALGRLVVDHQVTTS